MRSIPKLLKLLALLISASLLSGCNLVVMNPSGDIAIQQRDLILLSTGLMLVIIIPVMAVTLFFAWKYRASNKDAEYEPDWDHSTKLEVLIWSAPLVIIVILGTVTWITTHDLDPYQPLARISKDKAIQTDIEPLEVQVVALDWKWLFIYPEYGVASVNEMAAPIDRPINFKITSSGVMNSFYVPALAGQIYAMAGMQTQLNAVINEPGIYDGISANYSGDGFSHMRFKFHGLNDADFESWVTKLGKADEDLTRRVYRQLEKPSRKNPVKYYASVDEDLYHAILNMCVDRNNICADDMMYIDETGGGGIAALDKEIAKVLYAGICVAPQSVRVARINENRVYRYRRVGDEQMIRSAFAEADSDELPVSKRQSASLQVGQTDAMTPFSMKSLQLLLSQSSLAQ